MEKTAASAYLVDLIREVGNQLGLSFQDVQTGGTSDGNFVSELGIPTLDGLGPIGGLDHSPDEYLDMDSIVHRTALLAGFITEIATHRDQLIQFKLKTNRKGIKTMKPEEVVQAARKAGLRLIRFLYCDNGGVIRGKLTHIEGLERRLKGGIGLTVAMQAFSMLDNLVPFEGMGPVGEVRIMPDPNSFRILPYEHSSAAMVSDLLTLDGKPWEACPRSFLKRMIARAAQHGITIQTAMENEFILCQEQDGKMVPADEALCFSSVGMHEAGPVINDIIAAFEGMGIQVDLYHPEYGPGQHEITICHAEALTAADFRSSIVIPCAA